MTFTKTTSPNIHINSKNNKAGLLHKLQPSLRTGTADSRCKAGRDGREGREHRDEDGGDDSGTSGGG